MSLSRTIFAVAALLLGAASIADGEHLARAAMVEPAGGNEILNITVFALKTEKLDLPGKATAAYIGFNLNANKLATARVTGLYAR